MIGLGSDKNSSISQPDGLLDGESSGCLRAYFLFSTENGEGLLKEIKQINHSPRRAWRMSLTCSPAAGCYFPDLQLLLLLQQDLHTPWMIILGRIRNHAVMTLLAQTQS